MRKQVIFSLVLGLLPLFIQAQLLPGFTPSIDFGEQQMVIEDSPTGTRILINALIKGFGNNEKILLIFYALPNGSSIEHTFGKKPKKGDDFRFDIQHIGAQTRFLRSILKERTIVVAYVEATQKSWPSWVAGNPDAIHEIKEMVASVGEMYARWSPEVVLNGHSGGGRFILSYINAAEEIPANVVRIAFLDSSYGHEDTPMKQVIYSKQ